MIIMITILTFLWRKIWTNQMRHRVHYLFNEVWGSGLYDNIFHHFHRFPIQWDYSFTKDLFVVDIPFSGNHQKQDLMTNLVDRQAIDSYLDQKNIQTNLFSFYRLEIFTTLWILLGERSPPCPKGPTTLSHIYHVLWISNGWGTP